MGLLEGILGKGDGVSHSKGGQSPFKVSCYFIPLRLSSRKNNDVDLVIKITNITDSPKIVSVDAELPKGSQIGFDRIGIKKRTEKRVGELLPGKSKEASIRIYANTQSPPAEYDVEITVFSHFENYSKVMEFVKKTAKIRVV